MILIDSNVPMYLVGAGHPHKTDALRLLDDLIARGERLTTDVEVLQEILHRYSAIDRIDAIQPAFDAALDIVDDVLPVHLGEAEKAKEIVLGCYGASARDALHIAVMRANEISRITRSMSASTASPASNASRSGATKLVRNLGQDFRTSLPVIGTG